MLHAASGEDALRLLEQQPAETGVITLGGDGTVTPLLPDIVRWGRPLLPIAGGTGNDFSATLERRAGDIGSALDHCSAGLVYVDAIRVRYGTPEKAVGERLMLNGSGMGFDAQLTASLPRVAPQLTGLARYLAAALLTLREMNTARLSVRVDAPDLGGGLQACPQYSGPAMLCAVMNGRSVGGGFQFSPQALVCDGLLDVIVAGDIGRAGVVPLIGRVLARRHLGHAQVRRFVGRRAELCWDVPVHLHIDGDVAGRFTWLSAEVLPRVVPLLGALPPSQLAD